MPVCPWYVNLNDGITVRWYPGDWTLKERKQRSEFCAVIHDSPAELNTELLIKDQQFLIKFGIKSYKIIRLNNNKNKFIAYFENFDVRRAALHTPAFQLFGMERKWITDNFSPRKGKKNQKNSRPPKDEKTPPSDKKTTKSNKSSNKKNKKTSTKKSDRKNNNKSREDSLTRIAELLTSLIKETKKKNDRK